MARRIKHCYLDSRSSVTTARVRFNERKEISPDWLEQRYGSRCCESGISVLALWIRFLSLNLYSWSFQFATETKEKGKCLVYFFCSMAFDSLLCTESYYNWRGMPLGKDSEHWVELGLTVWLQRNQKAQKVANDMQVQKAYVLMRTTPADCLLSDINKNLRVPLACAVEYPQSFSVRFLGVVVSVNDVVNIIAISRFVALRYYIYWPSNLTCSRLESIVAGIASLSSDKTLASVSVFLLVLIYSAFPELFWLCSWLFVNCAKLHYELTTICAFALVLVPKLRLLFRFFHVFLS